ncbi:hypothetical protein E4U31_003316 [Claviceps sp. LM219 group G6]|nr:hypothetical protein E4U31_003316 [Claviceps sp. LM219 group G6]
MSSGSLWDLVVLSWLDQMDEIGEGTSLPTSDDIEISFIGIPVNIAALVSNMVADDMIYQLTIERQIRVTSRAVSALPREPAAVEKRTNTVVFLSLCPKHEAVVILL